MEKVYFLAWAICFFASVVALYLLVAFVTLDWPRLDFDFRLATAIIGVAWGAAALRRYVDQRK